MLPQYLFENSEWLQNYCGEEERAQLNHQLGNLMLLFRRKNS